jgi:glycosyltransferase involved in cell wall biosynthesis
LTLFDTVRTSAPLLSITDIARQTPSDESHPRALLYATSAGLGGSGLDTTSLEGALAAHRAGFLSRAVCFANRQKEIPSARIKSLRWSPVRLLSNMGSKDYYAAKKRWLDHVSEKLLQSGAYDFFHCWSGESFRSLIESRSRGIPSVMDVPTWHRNKGVIKPSETKSEREARLSDRGWKDWRKHLHSTRLETLTEYDLADVLLMPSAKSKETFLTAGIAENKLHYIGRGVDIARYQPAAPPDIFRVAFTGALIKRKGVHHLLAAWKRLNLRNAELVLIGSVHEEMKPYLNELKTGTVRLAGFTSSVQDELRQCAAFVFPSECEGFAKATLEAAACALPLIATRESGDAIVDGETGIMIPPNNPDSLAAALDHCAQHRDEILTLGQNARKLVEQRFTWDHYRERVLGGYAKAVKIAAHR